MPGETRSQYSLSYNLELIMEQVKLFPRVSLIIILIVTVFFVFLGVREGYPTLLLIFVLIRNVFGLTMLKSMILFGRYRYFYGTPYPGSILVTSAMLSAIVFTVFARPEFLLATGTGQGFGGYGPFGMALIMSGMFFVVMSANMAISNWWHRKHPGKKLFRRQIGLED